MKIASWNVNSLKVRLPHLLDWLKRAEPDIVGLQETKCLDDRFPLEQIEAAGYRALVNGQKTYNGVALLSRVRDEPCEVLLDLPTFEDHQRRVLAATYGDLRVVNLYVPNGSEVGSDKYEYKLNWLAALVGHLRGELARHPRLLVMGDFNIAPEDRDVFDSELWAGGVLASEPERQAFRDLLALGLKDSFRLFEQPEQSFSWWDYRQGAFRRNYGLRIDHILLSEPLARRCRASRIDREPRTWERPSDHAPVVVELER